MLGRLLGLEHLGCGLLHSQFTDVLIQSFVPSLIPSFKHATHWGPEVNEVLPDLKQLSEPQRRSRHVEGRTYGTGPH